MENIVDFEEYKAKRDDAEAQEWMDICLDMEDEIQKSMAMSVSHKFVNRMVEHYDVSPTLVIAQIMTALISRNIHELTANGDEGAKEVFALMSHLGGEFCEDFDVDLSREARDQYLDVMFSHRYGETFTTTDDES